MVAIFFIFLFSLFVAGASARRCVKDAAAPAKSREPHVEEF
jgi:hypothetical protein